MRFGAVPPWSGVGHWAARFVAGVGALAAVTMGAQAGCLPVAERAGGVVPASFRLAESPAAGTVRLTFLGHASFLIESAEGVRAVTDYNGVVRAPEVPDIVTMNNAHPTHYTNAPDPEIPHVLRGWDPDGGIASHDLTLQDMRVRNVPTNIRDIGLEGGRVGGNSIFVFEVADLCIAHLGHLHHTLTKMHLAELGAIDVLLVPVDGGYTMTQELMVEVIDQIRPAVVVPMHAFSTARLERFLDLVRARYQVRVLDSPTVALSRGTLPYRQVLVLPGE